MSGSDFLWWLESIWFDLTNLDTADLPSLMFRLALLVLLIFCGTFFLRVMFSVLGGLAESYVLPPLRFLWDVLTYPLRLPFRLVRRVVRRVRQARRYRESERRELARKAEQEREQREAERRERERIAELQKVLKVD